MAIDPDSEVCFGLTVVPTIVHELLSACCAGIAWQGQPDTSKTHCCGDRWSWWHQALVWHTGQQCYCGRS